MKLSIAYRHFEPTEAIEQKICENAEHLNKYFKGKVEVSWVCAVDGAEHSSEVTAHCGHQYYHAHAAADSLYATLDIALAKIERQVRRANNKQRVKIHRPQAS